MVFVSLRELAMNRSHPLAQCSFSLTYVDHDFRLLPRIGKCQFLCVPFSARCHCKSIACGQGTRVFLVIFRQHQGLKHGRSPHLSPPRVGSPSGDGGSAPSAEATDAPRPKREARRLRSCTASSAMRRAGQRSTGQRSTPLRPSERDGHVPRRRCPQQAVAGGRGEAGLAPAELRGAAPAVRGSPRAGC